MPRRLQRALTIHELQRQARDRVPRMFYEYADSGSWTRSTYDANESDFGRVKFRQRILVDMDNRSLATKMAGQDVGMPVALAPTGMCGMQHANGEIHAARAAEAAGLPFTLSTMSICSIEDVAEATSAPFWFQLYVLRDRPFMERLIERANAADCSALMLTVDLQILGQRHNDIRNELGAPPKPSLNTLMQFATRPEWCARMLATAKRWNMGNIVGHATGVDDLGSLSSWTSQQFDPRLSWADVAWVKERWGSDRPLILKGIMDADDARSAVAHGADALIVSNHGGRQLDGAPSSIAALPAIVDAVGKDIEVHMDGGVRSGQDVMRALCLGARGVYIGRPFLYGLGAGGEAGVTRAIEILRKELDLTMALCGERDIRNVGEHNLANQPWK